MLASLDIRVNNPSRRIGRATSALESLHLSDVVRNEPEVAEVLAGDMNLVVEPFDAKLKGFEDEEFRLWRAVPT
jgi:hypothetical protein